MMDFPKLLISLERFGKLLPEVVRDLDLEDSRWRPPDDAWSILEIVCHLGDEEEFDFRERAQRTLANPDGEWPSIAPQEWAIERRYNERELHEAVRRFVSLRRDSVQWLRSLTNPDWTRTHQASFGPMRAGDLAAAWVAHDCLHLRQIAKRMYQLAARDAGEYSVRYAGEWTA